MPVLWNVFHSPRLVVVSIQGSVCLKDMEDCVEATMTPATLSYRKLVDLSEGQLALSRADMAALAQCVRQRSGSSPMGALAIAVGSEEGKQQARLFESLSVADRPLKIFHEVQAARDWLQTQPPPALPLWLSEEASAVRPPS
jgi:hypothetical protein